MEVVIIVPIGMGIIWLAGLLILGIAHGSESQIAGIASFAENNARILLIVTIVVSALLVFLACRYLKTYNPVFSFIPMVMSLFHLVMKVLDFVCGYLKSLAEYPIIWLIMGLLYGLWCLIKGLVVLALGFSPILFTLYSEEERKEGQIQARRAVNGTAVVISIAASILLLIIIYLANAKGIWMDYFNSGYLRFLS